MLDNKFTLILLFFCIIRLVLFGLQQLLSVEGLKTNRTGSLSTNSYTESDKELLGLGQRKVTFKIINTLVEFSTE